MWSFSHISKDLHEPVVINVNDNEEIVMEVESLPSFLSFADIGDGTGVLYPLGLSIESGIYSFLIKASDPFSSITSKIFWKIKPEIPLPVVQFDSGFMD